MRTHNDLKQWFKFFLVGIIETTQKGVETFDAILKLKKETEELIQNSSRSHHIINVLTQLYQRPIINVLQLVKYTGVSKPTAYNIIKEMQGFGILKEMTGGKRGQIFMFEPYINLF